MVTLMGELDAFSKLAPHLANPLVLVGFVLLLFFGIHRTLIKSGIIQPVPPKQSGTIVIMLLRYGFIIALVLIVAGFGLAAWETYRVPGPKVDVNAIVQTLLDKHNKDLAVARKREETSQAHIKKLTETVAALATQSEQPDAPFGAKEALQKLAEGNTKAAEAIFQDTLDRKEAEGQSANKEAAEAARHLGVLASLSDVKRALAAYRKATTLDPSNMEGWLGLGDAARSAGRVEDAERAFRHIIELAEKIGDEREASVGLNRLGDVQVAQGDLTGALESYRASHAIAKRLAASDKNNAGWQRDLSVSHNNIGDVQVAQGDLTGALESYRASHAIDKRLAASDKNNAGWQRDLSVSHNKIGNVQVAQGDLTGALESYRASHAIRERLAASDKNNAGWQRDLAWSHWSLAQHGNQPQTHWQKVVDIFKKLDAEGRLAPTDQKWLPIAEKNLAAAAR